VIADKRQHRHDEDQDDHFACRQDDAFVRQHAHSQLTSAWSVARGRRAGAHGDARSAARALRDAGDRVVSVCRQRGRSKTTGIPVEMLFGMVWTVRDWMESRFIQPPSTRKAPESAASASTATGIRTRVSAMRGRRPSPLDDSGAKMIEPRLAKAAGRRPGRDVASGLVPSGLGACP
jgi:hypothetical protein